MRKMRWKRLAAFALAVMLFAGAVPAAAPVQAYASEVSVYSDKIQRGKTGKSLTVSFTIKNTSGSEIKDAKIAFDTSGGEIWDEDEEIIRDFVRIDSQHFLISGDLTIRELFDHLDLPFSNLESNHTSCGGWALEALGHIPQAGEAFRFKNMTLTIQEMDDQRVKKLSVYLAPQPEEEEKSRQESNQQE